MPNADTPPAPTLSDVGERLVGTHEIARMFDVSRQTVHDWLKRPERFGFPEPYDRIRAGAVWLTEDVIAWGKDSGRKLYPQEDR